MKIIDSGKFDKPIYVRKGDTFQLHIDDEIVHTVELNDLRVKLGRADVKITHWVCFEIGETGIAYAIGEKGLKREIEAGAK